MKRVIYPIACAAFLLPGLVRAGGPPSSASDSLKKWEIGGYLKDLQSIQFTSVNNNWFLINLIHNREDFHWYPGKRWKVHVGMRNRIYYGESVDFIRQNPSLFNSANSYFKLQKIISDGPSYLVHSTFDRASVTYTKGKWEMSAGRQRINWGQNLVWNPNDIFNAYSYFNFDYEEKPGADALRLQYYPTGTSVAEVAYKLGKNSDSTIIAGKYRFAKGSYDLQVLGGWMNGDYVLGAGWSGVIRTAGFNGEVTAFVPHKNLRIQQTVLSASAGMNYTFSNSLYLHIAYLYNSAGSINADSNQMNVLFRQVVSAKNLSPARHSLFAEVAYQITPLLKGDFSGILDPSDGSFFLGPFFTYSLSDNVAWLTGGQLFFGTDHSLYGSYGKFLFTRLKWSF
ncbi:MAG: hypothetical protein GC180_07905 [Bacteroidetes bacterium]|nr:hypothetical protein [Bacteroidota bacterium]